MLQIPQDVEVGQRFAGIMNAQAGYGKGRLYPIELPLDDSRVVHVKGRTEFLHQFQQIHSAG